MRHYKSSVDACYGMIFVLAALMALLFSCATIDYILNTDASYAPRHHIHFPLACLFVFIVIARWQLFHSRIRWWVYLGLLIPSVYVITFQTGWFRDELHDFAMIYFQSHGRFGCHDEHYGSYIFRDDTAPWILFGPFLFATVCHWFYGSPAALARFHSLIRWSTTYESRKMAA